MSAYIKCKLEIKSLEMLKKVLDIMNLHYQEGDLIAHGYGSITKPVNVLVTKEELSKNNIFSWGDLGFVYNKKTQQYDAIVDEYSKKIVNEINKNYAVEVIKNFASANRYNYSVINNENKNGNIVIEVF